MLAKIIRMDWILSRRHILLNSGLFCLYALYMVYRMESPKLFSMFAAIMASFGSFVVLTREDRFKAAATTVSLPVDRRQVVFARYFLGWGIGFGTLLLTFGLAILLKTIGAVEFPPFTAGHFALAVAVVGIIVALLFPFVVRFGWTGLVLFLVSLQVLGAVFLLAAGYGGLHISLRAFPTAIGSWSVKMQQTLGWPLFFIGLILGLAFLSALSVLASVILFRKREF